MARGSESCVGDERVSNNGYTYVKTEDGWELKHRLEAGKMLGRPIGSDEQVRFKDGDRQNFNHFNLEVYKVKKKSVKARRAKIEAKMEELKAELRALEREEKANA